MAHQGLYDFAVLGTNQPEGLLLAAGLSRKGYSVILVPSPFLGELASAEGWPLYFPESIGEKKFEDLLFKVGFFRLEESGLSESNLLPQVILPRHRLTLGRSWKTEFDREFPGVSETLVRYWSVDSQTQIRRILSEMKSHLRLYPELKAWIDSRYFLSTGRHSTERVKIETRILSWLRSLPKQGSRYFRVDPNLKEPYNLFLLEHARKWGVEILEESFALKTSWRSYFISSQIKAKRLIINSSAASKMLIEASVRRVPSRVLYWLYFDEVVVDFEKIPEPLEDISHYIPTHLAADELRKISLHRDYSKRKVAIRLGTWLPFDQSRDWISKIEESRKFLRRLLPFLSEEVFSSMPSVLELTEEKGECVRRGQVGRLLYDLPQTSSFPVWRKWSISSRFSSRVFSVTPHFLPLRNRASSLSHCYEILNQFSKSRGAALDSAAKQ